VEDYDGGADLVRILRSHAQTHGDRVAVQLAHEQGLTGRLTYAEVDRRAQAVAALLRAFTKAGDRVVLLFPADPDFLPALFGCWYAGVVAVPLPYPVLGRHGERSLQQLAVGLEAVAPALVLTTDGLIAELGDQNAALLGRYASVGQAAAVGLPWENDRAGHEIAVLQHTSGSTGQPKGVLVSHQNYAHNLRMLTDFTRSIAPDVRHFQTVSWLPNFHDMGLALLLFTLHHAGTSTLIAPMSFLRDPGLWLRTISEVGGNLTAAPNFAYDLCVRRVSREAAAAMDLSTMGIMLNAAEPVRADTMHRFTAHFAPAGFQAAAFAPAFGLAEGTVFVSGLRYGGDPPRTIRFDRRSLQDGVARPGGLEATSHTLVSCGRRPDGMSVRIVDPAGHTECPPGTIGEIWVHGPSVALGYWQRTAQTAAVFAARLAGFDYHPYLRTGDLGFLWEGELFVVGRLADLIVLGGRLLQPQDIEYTIERSHPTLEGRRSAVFAYGEEEGRLAAVVEMRLNQPMDDDQRSALEAAIRDAVAAEHDVEISEVLILRTGAIPVTTSGKVRRARCRQMLLSGALAGAHAGSRG